MKAQHYQVGARSPVAAQVQRLAEKDERYTQAAWTG